MDKVKIAIVGCGNISQLNVPGYLQHPYCEVYALCDTMPARARMRAQQWGITPKIYTEYTQVLNDANIDAIELLTPTPVHAEQIIAAVMRASMYLVRSRCAPRWQRPMRSSGCSAGHPPYAASPRIFSITHRF